MTDEEFDDFVDSTSETLEKKQSALVSEYHLGSFPTYFFDQERASLQFRDSAGNVVVEADVTLVGTFDRKKNTWMWAWANESVLPRLRTKAEQLKKLYELTGFSIFGSPSSVVDDDMPLEFTAMAVELLHAIGCYHAPSADVEFFLAINGIARR